MKSDPLQSEVARPRRSTRWLSGVLLCTLGLIVATSLWKPPAPSFGGKPVSEWFEEAAVASGHPGLNRHIGPPRSGDPRTGGPCRALLIPWVNARPSSPSCHATVLRFCLHAWQKFYPESQRVRSTPIAAAWPWNFWGRSGSINGTSLNPEGRSKVLLLPSPSQESVPPCMIPTSEPDSSLPVLYGLSGLPPRRPFPISPGWRRRQTISPRRTPCRLSAPLGLLPATRSRLWLKLPRARVLIVCMPSIRSVVLDRPRVQRHLPSLPCSVQPTTGCKSRRLGRWQKSA